MKTSNFECGFVKRFCHLSCPLVYSTEKQLVAHIRVRNRLLDNNRNAVDKAECVRPI